MEGCVICEAKTKALISFAVTLLSYVQNIGFLMTRLICILTEAVTHVEVSVLQWFSFSLPRAVSSIPGFSSISDES